MKPENLGLFLSGLATAGALAVVVPAESAHAAADQPVMFILDASSSMKDGAAERSKIEQVRDLIAKTVSREAESRDLGLIAFGARDKTSCSDVQTVAPLGARERIFQRVLGSVEPRGEAPISKALESAVTMVARKGEPGAVILIADGGDSCGADPCAAARELKKKSPEVVIHTIGFASGAAEGVDTLACIADESGGSFRLIRSESDLTKAVTTALDARPVTSALAFGSVTEEKEKDGEGGRPRELDQIVRSMTPRHPTLSLSSPLSALVAPDAAVEGTNRAPKIADVLAANISAGLFNRRAFAPIGPGGPAAVELAAVAANNQPPLTAGVVWRVFKAEPDAAGNHPLVVESRDAAPKLTLDPGDYIVHCAFGKAQVAKRIQINGEPLSERMVLNAGALQLDAVVDDSNSSDEKLVPEGQASFAIYRGDPETSRDSVLVVPFLRPGQTIRLTEGKYHVISHYGDANAMVRANVRIEAGRMTRATVYHKAARVTLRLLSGPAGEALANTSWKIMNPSGEVVKESVGAFPSHILEAGDYTVVAEHEQQKFQSVISIESGQDRDIEVIADE